MKDFTQDLGKLTPNQWLEQYINGNRDHSSSHSGSNIHDIFKAGIQCHTMFLPSTNEENLKHLGMLLCVTLSPLVVIYVNKFILWHYNSVLPLRYTFFLTFLFYFM